LSTQTFKMQSPSPNDARIAEIAKIAETQSDIVALQHHVKEVIEGEVFKGSHRSGQFLQYIVDQAIAGHCDSLKERVIGMDLFGRSASYDTGDDAIVRVTASDVRRRLLEHYGRYGATSEFRITLPSGSYIPDITRKPNGVAAVVNGVAPRETTLSPDDSTTAIDSPLAELPRESVENHPDILQVATAPSWGFSRRIWLFAAIAVAMLSLAVLGVLWIRVTRPVAAPIPVLPWSTFFGSSHATEFITSDPNIAVIQGITGSQVSLSDYANHNYFPVPNKLTPEQDNIVRNVLRGDNSAGVDAPIVAKVAALAQANSKSIDVRAARSIQLTDLKSDNNFIFLGSPRSDPWFSLFSDQLDFRFVFDKNSASEFIRNIHPRPNEQQQYVPSAPGWATGDSYAVVALVKNPDQSGQVLLLAGANEEGTEAAGKVATDLTRLSTELRKCGITPSGPVQHFEMLLHLNTMAGTPNNIDLVACHILADVSAH
jgi:hypothetical protein